MALLISFGVSSSERLLEQLPLFWAPSGPFGAPFLPLPGQLRRLYGGPVPGRPHLEISKTCLSNTHTHTHTLTHTRKKIYCQEMGEKIINKFFVLYFGSTVVVLPLPVPSPLPLATPRLPTPRDRSLCFLLLACVFCRWFRNLF